MYLFYKTHTHTPLTNVVSSRSEVEEHVGIVPAEFTFYQAREIINHHTNKYYINY